MSFPRVFLALGILGGAAVYAQTPTVLNLSHDLTTMGIAASNMTPNQPAVDSRASFEAGVKYANTHGIPTVTADRGSYYFLTQDAANYHVNVAASNLTIDLAYSDLHFANPNAIGMLGSGGSGLTLQNFTMDYITLPFTQVMVTAVNATARTISFQPIPGWPSPTALNSLPTTGTQYLMFDFRSGQQIRETAWMPAVAPFSGTTITVGSPVLQGSSSTSLAAIQAGDTLVITWRNGGGMFYYSNTQNLTLRNVTIYSSAQFAFDIQFVGNSTFDQLQVIPRPGTDRLISANADGIHISASQANNTISNSTVRRACDDGIIIDGQWSGTISAAPTGASVPVTLDAASFVQLSAGMSVDFINIANAGVFATATITAVNPAPAQQKSGGAVTLTLDHAVTGLQAGFGVIPDDPAYRGGGSVIRGNLVWEEVFDRGIYIPGVEGVTVTDNMIDTTNNGGIVIGEDDNTGYAYKTGPASNVTIHNNVVNNALEYGYPSMPTVENGGAIMDYVENQNYDYVTNMPDSNFTITGNLITNTPRSGVRVQSLNGGTISSNTILSANLEPTKYIDTFSAGWGETLQQTQSDYGQPVVIANSAGVANSNNTTTGSIIYNVSAAYGGRRQAPGSMVSAYGTNLAAGPATNTTNPPGVSLGGVTVTVTDNTGTSRQAPLYYVSPGLVNYQIPAGTAPGIVQVTIGNSVGGALVGTVAPGLFSADGSGTGVAAALALRIAADSTQTPVTVFQCSANGCVSVPMSLGSSTDKLELVLYGTGIQGRSLLSNVVAQIGGVPADVVYAGPTVFPGLDQINVFVPRSLAGAGEVPVFLMVDGQSSNALKVNIQ